VEQAGCEIRAMPLADPLAADRKMLGDFRIGREIGRRGMGIVYEGLQHRGAVESL
jgi:hypothetical protein